MNKIIIPLVALFFFHNLSAQTKPLNKPGKTIETYEDSETELKLVYQSVIDIVAKEHKVSLIDAQNDWLQFRESECKFEISDITDEAEKAQANKDCLFELNKRRIKDLMASYIILRLK